MQKATIKQIKSGYKKTPVGIIPKDWEVKRLKQISKLFGRIGYRGYTKEDIVVENEGAITLSPSNFENGKLNLDSCTFISWFKYEESPEIKIFNGDILMVKTGSTYGKTAYVDDLNGEATINPQIVVVKDIKVNNKFLAYLFINELVQKQVDRIVVGGAIPTMSQKEILKFKLPIPPLPEQKAIADCLSTWDKAIEKQTQLIHAKKQFKKGLMQGFFNGHFGFAQCKQLTEAMPALREPQGTNTTNRGQRNSKPDLTIIKAKEGEDFREDWRNIPLKKVGGIPAKDAIKEINERKTLTVRLYTKGVDFSDNAKTKITESGRNYYVRKKDEILIGRQNIHNGGVGLVQPEHDGHICSNALTSFVVNNENSLMFIWYLLSNPDIHKSFEKYMTGTGQKELSEKQLLKLIIMVPNSKLQTAIAQVLQSADKEIELLEKKLAQLQLQKKGLMQVLLTGEKRLI